MLKTDKIFVAGHNGMVGSAIYKLLIKNGYTNIVTKNRTELDLTNQTQVETFFKGEQPDYVFLCAAKVGGILANKTYKADYIYDNLMIQNNVIHNSYKYNVKKLLFLGSSCIYPKDSLQPIKEEYLLTGKLEETNDAYALAKIAGIKMCQSYYEQYGCNFISVMPTNLLGDKDCYDLNNSHVLPALIRKIHEAKINKQPFIEVWGSGKPRREFLHSEDLAEACLFLMLNYNKPNEIINIGTGEDITIESLVYLIISIIGYNGEVKFDKTKPDGTFRKLLDVKKINDLGWKHKINLHDGISKVYKDFKTNYLNIINQK